MADLAQLELRVNSLEAKQAARDLEKLSRESKEAEQKANRHTKAMDRQSRAAKRLRDGAGNAAKAIRRLFAGLTLVATATAAVRTMAQFESTMTTVLGVTRATTEEFERLTATARRLGATTRFSATEAGEGLLFLARAGFSASEAIAAVPATLNLAAAGGLALGEAADFASNIVSQFGLAAAETTRVVDTLVNTANSANTDVRQLAEAMKFAGPVAGALGIDVEKTAAAIGVLGDSGIQASLAGTNLRGTLAALLGPTGSARKALERMNVSLEDVNPASNDLVDIFRKLEAAGLSAGEAVAIFGRRNAAAALVLAANIDKVEDLTEANRAARDEAERLAKLQSQTLAGSFKALRSAIEEVFLATGDRGLTGSLKSMVTTATSAIRIMGGFADGSDQANHAAQNLVAAIRTLVRIVGLLLALRIVRWLQSTIPLFVQMATAIRGAASAATILNASLGVVGLVAVVATAVVALREFEEASNRVRQAQLGVADAVFSASNALDLGKQLERSRELRETLDLLNRRNAELSRFANEISNLEKKLPRRSISFEGVPQITDLNAARDVAASVLSDELQDRISRLLPDLPFGDVLSQTLAVEGDKITISFDRLVSALQDLRDEEVKQIIELDRKITKMGERDESERAARLEMQRGQLEMSRLTNEIRVQIEALGQQGDALERSALVSRFQAAALLAFKGDQEKASEAVAEFTKLLDELASKGAVIEAGNEGLALTFRSITEEAARSANAVADFLTSSGGGGGATSSSRTASSGFAAQLTKSADFAVDAVDNLLKEVERRTLQTQAVLSEIAFGIGDAFGRAFEDAIVEAKDFGEVLQNLLKDIQRTLIRTLVALPLRNLIGQGLGGLLGGITPAGAFGGSVFSAMGNVFQGGDVKKFASGGVIDRPIMFPLKSGRGIAGEAGPEAIVPLKRTSGGNLGVEVAGSNGASNVSVTMHVHGVRDPQGFMRSERQITASLRRAVGRR